MKSHIATAAPGPLDLRLSATPRGARLARRLTAERLAAWGYPYDGEVSGAVGAVVGELAANAVTHGRVPGRDFGLRVSRTARGVRVEVSDAGHAPLPSAVPEEVDPEGEGGRGLLIVAALACRWGCQAREPGPAPGKTVWAEVDDHRASGTGPRGPR